MMNKTLVEIGMKPKSFNQYKLLREAEDNKSNVNAVGTKVSLGDGNQYKPFEISDDTKSEHYGKNKNLAPIVRAFKSGANWGWSRDDNTGSDKPVKISGKKLFLAGGAVRDHLAGKKPRNIELATNASPDEVYHILKQNGFSYLGKQDESSLAKESPNQKPGSKQSFFVSKTNKKGRPFVFGIQVNEDTYTLEVFMKTPRGVDQDPESGTQIEDASGRDFTINGMYIALTNDNGPNKDLHDFFGGAHHLSSGRINAIGDLQTKLSEDPSRILRYVRMMTGYGDPKKMSPEDTEVIRNLSSKLGQLDRKLIMDEFRKGMSKDDTDSRTYLKCCNDLGVLDQVFPGKILDTKFPTALSEIGDKHMPLAFMLRFNDPSSLSNTGLDANDLQKVAFLIKSMGLSDAIDPSNLSDLTNSYLTSGIPSRKLRDFATKIGGLDGGLIDAFLGHAKMPRVKIFIQKDGNDQVADDFQDLIDPFSGQVNQDMADERRKQLELDSFKNQLAFMRPQ
jgi:hypothetical protein